MATTLPTQQKSLLLLQKQGDFAVQTTPVPKAGPGELLVEIHSTALNPVDWKIQAYGTVVENYPAVLGSDCAGVVKQVGEGVTEFAVGDKIVHQGYYDNRRATFQQYTIVPAEIAAKIPPNLTFDEASTIPVTLAATAGGLYNEKVLPIGGAGLTAPWEAGGRGKYKNQPILIMGGSSSVGQHAIQLAKLSGFSPIITTASVRHTEYLKSLGATHVLDRDDATLRSLGSAVKAITQEPVKVAYDAISLPETQNAAYDVLADGGQIVLVTSTIAVDEKKLAGSNKEIVKVWGNVHLPVYRSLGISMYKHLTSLLEAGDIKPNRIELVPNGLVGIPAALKKLKAGVSAMKFVARPQETPEE